MSDQIRTLDGVALVQRNLAAQLSHYPEGSVSPREVICDLKIKGDQEKYFQQLNSKITKAIFSSAEAIGQKIEVKVRTLEWSKKYNETLTKAVVSSTK